MRTNKSFVSLALATAALSGCMGLQSRLHPLPEIPEEPSREWVEMNLPEFKRITEQYPTEENRAALNRLEMYAAYCKELTLRASRVDRSLSLAWINTGRAGAAMRQPAYVHSLGGDFNTETRNGAALDPRRGARSTARHRLRPHPRPDTLRTHGAGRTHPDLCGTSRPGAWLLYLRDLPLGALLRQRQGHG